MLSWSFHSFNKLTNNVLNLHQPLLTFDPCRFDTLGCDSFFRLFTHLLMFCFLQLCDDVTMMSSLTPARGVLCPFHIFTVKLLSDVTAAILSTPWWLLMNWQIVFFAFRFCLFTFETLQNSHFMAQSVSICNTIFRYFCYTFSYWKLISFIWILLNFWTAPNVSC